MAQGPERRGAGAVGELKEVGRWLEDLRGIVSALFQRDVKRRGGVTPPLFLLPLRPLNAVKAQLSKSAPGIKEAFDHLLWLDNDLHLCLVLPERKVFSFDLINYPAVREGKSALPVLTV